MPNLDQLLLAAEWLHLNEGPNGESEACVVVARWIENEIQRRQKDTLARAAAKKHGVSCRTAKAAINRIEARHAAGIS